jgi:O-acetyl-ADP-ribose deacetylase
MTHISTRSGASLEFLEGKKLRAAGAKGEGVTTLGTAVQNATMRLVLDQGKAVEIHGPGDLTEQTTDAIVNAANPYLLGGGGVDGAIHDAGGPTILAECRKIVSKMGTLAAGKAVITTAGLLSAKYVIHAVGPVYRVGERGVAQALASCHRESVRLADDHDLASLAFPAISTGAYGYPVTEAAPIAISATLEALASAKRVTLCRFVLFDVSTVRAYRRAAERLERLNTTPSFRIEKARA